MTLVRRVLRTPAHDTTAPDIARTSADAILGIPLPHRRSPGAPGAPGLTDSAEASSPTTARFTAVMEAIRMPRLGPGRPRTRPDHVLGGKGYSSTAIRTWLRRKNITRTIPVRAEAAGLPVLVPKPGDMLEELVRGIEHGRMWSQPGLFGRRCDEGRSPRWRGGALPGRQP